MYQKRSNIELGGLIKQSIGPYQHNNTKPHIPNPPHKHNQSQNLSESIVHQIMPSSQKITQKLSPGKRKLYPHQTPREEQVFQCENSSTNIRSSQTSMLAKSPSIAKQPFIDRTNKLISSSSQSNGFVKVNFTTSSPSSKNPSLTKEIQSSSIKDVVINHKQSTFQGQNRQVQLERKLRILQNRVKDLHRQKHELVGQMNEQNRRIYHQNTSLKLKISQLLKTRQKKGQSQKSFCLNRSSSQISKQTDCAEDNLSKLDELNSKISSLEEQLQSEGMKFNSLKNKQQELQQYNFSMANNLVNTEKQLKELKQHFNSKELQMMTLRQDNNHLKELNQEYLSLKQSLEQSLAHSTETHNLIVSEYQHKISEYKQAYNQNQRIIAQLTEQYEIQNQFIEQYQINQNRNSNKMVSIDQQNEDQVEIIDCQNLENNLCFVLEEKDQIIAELKSQVKELTAKLQANAKDYQQILEQNRYKTTKLQQVGVTFDSYNAKFKDMELRYEQLSQKYLLEIQNAIKPKEGVSQKCKKCDELMKTVIKLNSHLNPKRLK